MSDAESLQVLALFHTTGSGKNLSPGPPGDLDSRQPHAAGGSVHENLVTRTQPSELAECVTGSQKDHGDACHAGEAQAGGLDYGQFCVSRDEFREAPWRERDDLVAYPQVRDVRADSADHPGGFPAHRPCASRIKPQSVQHIPEVQRGSRDADLDLSAPGWQPGCDFDGDLAESARRRPHQSKGRVAWYLQFIVRRAG